MRNIIAPFTFCLIFTAVVLGDTPRTQEMVSKEIESHLAEYQQLRSEISSDGERLNAIYGYYISAILAILAYFLRPGKEIDAIAYFRTLREKRGVTVTLLLVAILNSALIIHVAELQVAVLTTAKYLALVISPRISELLQSPVMTWDRVALDYSSVPWSFLKRAASSSFALVALAVTISILANCRDALKQSVFLRLLYVASFLSLCLSLFSMLTVMYVRIKFNTGHFFLR